MSEKKETLHAESNTNWPLSDHDQTNERDENDCGDGLYRSIIRAILEEDDISLDDNLWPSTQRLLDALPFYVMLIDSYHTILYANKQIRDDLKVEPEEIIGGFCPKVIHGIDGPFPGCPMEATLRTGRPTEIDFYDEERKTWGRSSVFPMRMKLGDGRAVYFHMFRDITKEKESETNLNKERELVARIVETSPAGIIMIDKTGRITFANKQAEQIFGIYDIESLGLVYNSPELQLTDLEGNPIAEEELPFNIVSKTGQPAYDTRFTLTTSEGRRNYLSINAMPLFDDAGEIDGVVASISNITRMIKQAQALEDALAQAKAEKAKAEAILAATGDPLSIQDKEFRIVFQNQSAIDMMGDHVGEHCFKAFEHRDEICPDCPVARTMVDGLIHRGERFNEISGREPFFVQITASPLFDADGRITACIEVVRDITAQKSNEQMIKRERDRAQNYLDIAGVMIIAIDQNENVSLINKRGCSILGQTEKDIIGKNWFNNFVPLNVRDQLREGFKMLLEGKVEFFEYHDNPVLTSSGEERVIAWHNALLKNSKGKIVGTLSSGEDVTDQKRTAEALMESEEKYRQLVELSPDAIAIHSEGKFVFANSAAARLLGLADSKDLIGMPIMSIVHPDYAPLLSERVKSMDFDGNGAPLVEEKFIKSDGTAIDVEVIARPFDHLDKPATQVIARDITERKRIEKELHKRCEDIKKGMDSTIRAMALTVESRDAYTAGHQQGVSKIACAIANEMGLENNAVESIRIAGLLHDIGMLSVPAEILSKPGPVTQGEYNLIKQHPSVGYEILKEIAFSLPVAEIVLQHHERYDGSGYPNGFSGDDIMLEARILAIADVLEAMMAPRPYRAPLSAEEALAELNGKAGKLYDPRVVDACMAILSKKHRAKELLPAITR